MDTDEYKEEAERLAVLPRDLQKKALDLIRAPAIDPNVDKEDREEARQRADAVERHLRRLNRRKKVQLIC